MKDKKSVSAIGLTDLTSLREFLNKMSEDEDELLIKLIKKASKYICRECKRNFEKKVWTEYFCGQGNPSVVLRNLPIDFPDYSNKTSVEVADQLVGSGDFEFFTETGEITLKSGVFDWGIKNVKITYMGGYEFIPDDLQQACIELSAAAFRSQLIPQKVKFEDISTPYVQAVIETYKVMNF